MDTLGIDATPEEVDLMLSEIDLGKQLKKSSCTEAREHLASCLKSTRIIVKLMLQSVSISCHQMAIIKSILQSS